MKYRLALQVRESESYYLNKKSSIYLTSIATAFTLPSEPGTVINDMTALFLVLQYAE